MRLRTEAEDMADPINQPERFAEMDADRQRALLGWIAEALVPARRAGNLTSYGLKHEFGWSFHGFYVTNGEFKGAMLAAGYSPVDADRVNWLFRYRMRRAQEAAHPRMFWKAS